MLPGMMARRTSLLYAALAITLGALTGCRQAPLDVSYPAPDPDRTMAAPLTVDYDAPAGWVEDYGYSSAVNLYPAPHQVVLIPVAAKEDYANLDVISVTSSLMDVDVTGRSDDALVSMVKGYTAKLKAEGTAPAKTTVAGMTAFRTSIKQPRSAGGFYTYTATYAFAGTHLVEIDCQWEKQKAAVDTACAALTASVKVRPL